MADVADAPCGPPVFEGEPDDDKALVSFAWHDLLEGSGDFCMKDSSSARWKQMSSTNKDGVSVTTYSRTAERGGLSEFHLRGTLPVSRDSYFCVHVDMDHRPSWDESCLALTELSSSGLEPDAGPLIGRSRTLHWDANHPWPLGKRDYVLEQTVHSGHCSNGKVFRAVMARSIDPDVGRNLRPCDKGKTRIEDYKCYLIIWPGSAESECQFAMWCFEDGKLNVPNWVLTKATASTLLAQLTGLQQVAASYPRRRYNQTLARYGIAEQAKSSVESPPAQDAEEEEFFSASDDETPKTVGRKTVANPPPPPSPAMSVASKVESTPHATPRSSPASTTEKLSAKDRRRLSVSSKDRRIASKLDQALRLVMPQSDKANASDDDADLEEGVLVVGKEEKELLMNLLAEARAKQSATFWWCPCRRRCGGRKSTHKN